MIAFIFWLIILAAATTTAFPVWARMLDNGNYGYLLVGFVVLPTLFAIRVNGFRFPRGIIGVSLFAAGLGLIAYSFFQQSPWFASAGWATLISVFLACCSSRDRFPKGLGAINSLLGPVSGLIPLGLMLVQIPRNYDNTIVQKIYGYARELTSLSLDLLSIPNSTTARSIKLHGGDVLIADIHPLIFSPLVMAYALILIAVLKRRSPWAVVCYFIAGVLTSMFVNSLFALSIVVAKVHYSLDLLNGWPCVATYFTVGLIGLFFALSLDRFLLVTLFPTRPDDLNEWNNPIISLWNRAFSPETST